MARQVLYGTSRVAQQNSSITIRLKVFRDIDREDLVFSGRHHLSVELLKPKRQAMDIFGMTKSTTRKQGVVFRET
jgi:hypothetical protein